MVQLRYNFTLARQQFTRTLEQFTHTLEQFTRTLEQFNRTLEQFTHTCIELLVACALLPVWNSHKIIRWSSGVVFDTVTHVSIRYNVIDHHYVHRLVLGLISRSRNLCHKALIH